MSEKALEEAEHPEIKS